ncbi:MAG: hypothetical protein ACK2T7_03220 [Anaerolineales bacterium]
MKIPKNMRSPKDGDFFRNIAEHFQLIWKLWQDPRVNPLLKLLPLGGIIYLISPLDMAIPVIDDVGVLWFFSYLFIELVPEDIVEEHRRSIKGTYFANWKEDDETQFSEEDVQDAEFKEKFN